MIGRQVSHFYIIRSLGSGGMGVVYEAQDTRLPRSVAIKFLKPALSQNLDAIKRFKREARLASLLNHPNICTILDVDECDGQFFIVMELLEGRSLKARLAAGPPSLDEILDIAIQVADALATAHEQGIMHRDLTPGNIFLTGSHLVKLLDFGLAKHFPALDTDGQTSDDLTMPGTVAGTIYYMAPEQLTEDGALDHRCDLFSFGVVLYQMATGTRPFEVPAKHDVATLIQEHPHLPMRQLAPHHPVQLERVIDKLLAKRPEDRYQTAWALRAELDLMRRAGLPVPRPAARDVESGSASVAVLPFEIVGLAGPHCGHFRDGLTEDISSRLSGIRDLRVAPRTSTRPLAGESIRDVGKRLGVGMVLEGSVQQVDDRVRVTANLVDAASERSVVPRDPYNAAVFTSLGYFFLQPDIVFRAREPGLSVVECVGPAVKKVVQMGIVDPRRVGIVGHSWGGFDTTFLATHTDLFAAAVAGAPITDLVSNYGNHHWSSGIAETDHIETGQQRMEVPLWEDLPAYIRNSAVFNVHNMKTPLLVAFGDNDGTVHWHQGVELYNLARRARRDVVLLVYADEGHGLRRKPNQQDYHRRIVEWFSHYLKGEPAADWITQGVSHLDRQRELEELKARKPTS